jgi:phosphoglycolate phosphatase-like HAD superfamily hydrolase
VAADAMTPIASSASGEVKGDLVLAGYGISDKDLGIDEYDKLDVKGKIAVVRRFVPHGDKFEGREAERRFGSLDYKAWVARETALSNTTLRKEIEGGNQALAPVLVWSHAVNQAVERTVTNVPPLPYVRECLQKMGGKADRCVVTQTPTEALVREWEQHDIRKHVELSAGQELGTKTDHLRLAAGGKYPPDHILMIGDALGDLNAAKANRALFYPVMPGREAASWERLYRETLDRFFAGTYAGACEDELVREFEASLPEKPNW